MKTVKVKIEKVFIGDEKDVTSSKTGKTYNLCEVSIKVADDCKDYAGKWIKTSMFAFEDPKDSSKNRTALSKAEYFRTSNEGKDIIINVEEREYLDKEEEKKIALSFKLLSKKEKELAEQFLK